MLILHGFCFVYGNHDGSSKGGGGTDILGPPIYKTAEGLLGFQREPRLSRFTTYVWGTRGQKKQQGKNSYLNGF